MKLTVWLVLFFFPVVCFAAGNETITPLPAAQPNASSYTQTRTHLRDELPAIISKWLPGNFVVTGGLHATAAGMISDVFATEAFTDNGRRVTADGVGGAVAIGYVGAGCQTTDTAWVVISAQTANTIDQFIRAGTSNYFVDCVSATAPALPDDSAWLMKVTIAGGALSVIEDMRTRRYASSETITASQTVTPQGQWIFPLPGPIVTVSSGVTVTLSQCPIAGAWQIFNADRTTTGTITFLPGACAAVIPEWWGASPSGATDSGLAIQAALLSGASAVLLNGTYVTSKQLHITTSNFTLRGTSAGTSITALSNIDTTNGRAVVTVGEAQGSTTPVPVTDVTVSHVQLNGISLIRPLLFINVTRGSIFNVKTLNAGPTHAGIAVIVSSDVIVQNCFVSGAIGLFGDGMYFESVTNGQALNNIVENFTRIGIVFEGQENGPYSYNAIVSGNVVRHGHDATATEINAGIWLEHTIGGIITNNVVSDMSVNANGGDSRGIMLSRAGTTLGAAFIVEGNQVSGAYQGVRIDLDTTMSAVVTGLTVLSGTLPSYQFGVIANNGQSISISHCFFGTADFSGFAFGALIYTDRSTSVGVMRSITIDDVQHDAVTYTTDPIWSADYFLYGVSAELTTLILSNLPSWRLLLNETPVNVLIDRVFLSYNSTGNTGHRLKAKGEMRVSNATILDINAGAPIFGIGIGGAASKYIFTAVTFIHARTALSVDPAYSAAWQCQICEFGSGAQIYIDARVRFSCTDCYFDDYPSTGAFRGNFSNTGGIWSFTNTIFNSGSSYTPIQADNFPPDIFTLTNVTSNAAAISTITTTAGAGNVHIGQSP
jgi:hypothetical protein